MGCFTFLKTKPKSRKKQGKSGSEARAVSTTTTSSSNYETSQSYDSTGGKQANKSSVSTSSQFSSQLSISAMFEEKASGLRVFELVELRSATNDYNRTLKIGEGGFGSVYKGFIKPLDEKSGRITVAVKALNQRSLQVSFGLLFN